MLVQFISLQSGLELGAEEPVPIPRIAQHHEVECEYGDVEKGWTQNQAQSTGKEMLQDGDLQKIGEGYGEEEGWSSRIRV